MYFKSLLILMLTPLACYAEALQVTIYNDSTKPISVQLFLESPRTTVSLKPEEKTILNLTAKAKKIVLDFHEKYISCKSLNGHFEYQEKRYILALDKSLRSISLTISEILKAIAEEKGIIKGKCSIHLNHTNYPYHTSCKQNT